MALYGHATRINISQRIEHVGSSVAHLLLYLYYCRGIQNRRHRNG